jgi:hypothetical protein
MSCSGGIRERGVTAKGRDDIERRLGGKERSMEKGRRGA